MGSEYVLTSKISATCAAPTDRIVAYNPIPCDASECQANLQIGIFFDGTKNNMEKDEPGLSETNIARLFSLYPVARDAKIQKKYISGVGTRLVEISEKEETKFGSAFATGGYARVLLAMLWVLNYISMRVLNKQIFSAEQIKGLCSEDRSGPIPAALQRLGRDDGLMGYEGSEVGRNNFFFAQAKILEESIVASGVKVSECILDVFGFSRGAAQARVFCSWIESLTIDGKLAGVPVTFRFLGIFDTVASAGIVASIGGAIVNSTGGHNGWAKVKYLRVSSRVKTCVHMVAMHELRKNFPLDEVSVDGIIPLNCREVAYPGAHSDVGGGYAPGALGLACDMPIASADSQKLSQVPLRHMLDCAIAAGVPLPKKSDERFAVSAALAKAYNDFLDISDSKPKMLSEWMAPYMAWRWQRRNQFEQLGHVKRATEDRRHLIESNEQMMKDARKLGLKGDEELAKKFVGLARTVKTFDMKHPEYRQEDLATLDPEAPHVIASARAAAPVPPELAEFFDTYVHDSLAGFRKDLVERTGYWRYRRAFRGNDRPQLTKNDESHPKTETTA